MTEARPHHRYTFRDYLTLEESSSGRHEFLAGEIYAMAGGTPQHAALAAAIAASFVQSLRGGPCRVHSSDLRVRVQASGLTTYPDVSVICGDYQSDPGDDNTIVNPRLVVEVTSPSTEDYDRGDKLAHYKRVSSLGAVILVSHRERLLEIFERGPDGIWQRSEARAATELTVAALDCKLDVDQLYSDAGIS